MSIIRDQYGWHSYLRLEDNGVATVFDGGGAALDYMLLCCPALFIVS